MITPSIFVSMILFLMATFSPNDAPASTTEIVEQKVKQIQANAKEINPDVLTLAVTAYKSAKQQELVNNERLTIIDYSLPASEKRMWVINMEDKSIDYHTHVAHGKNSGG